MDDPSSLEGNAITLRIKFKSASLDEFVTRYGADVSAGGIFIRTKQPLAVGSVLHFDFSLGDGTSLMAGLGTVVWVREADALRAGSVPGMGLRFDQLTPEGQQTHQQILATKARRGDRPMVTPPPIPTFAPGTRPTPRPATPIPPTAARTTAPDPMAVPSPVPASSEVSDEFGGGGKTEIADRPPSFYFEAASATPTAGRAPAQDAVPAAPVEDNETDSQPILATDSSLSEPIDMGEVTSGGTPVTMGSSAQAATDSTAELPRVPTEEGVDLPPAAPAAGWPSPSPEQASAAAASVGGDEQSWLSRAMKATSSGAPTETVADHTEEVAAPPESAAPDAPALPLGGAERSAPGDADGFPDSLTDRTARKTGGQGKKLIVVGIVAAGVAFAGVYLLQTKPWQTASEPTPRSQPSAVAPSAPPRAPAKPSEPSPPPAPAPAPEKVAAATPPAKPAPVVASPSAAPSKGSGPAAEVAKPEAAAAESGKHSGHAGAAAKKLAAKSASPAAAPSAPAPTEPAAKPPAPAEPAAKPPAPAAAASAPAPGGQGEEMYFVKVKSTPPGAQVLIDGDAMGPTPFKRRILDMSKPHVVTVRKTGYDSYEQRITSSDAWVKSGNTSTLDVKAKLVRLKSQSGAQTPAPAAEAAPASDQPEKL